MEILKIGAVDEPTLQNDITTTTGVAEKNAMATDEVSKEELHTEEGTPTVDIEADFEELYSEFPALSGRGSEELVNRERYEELRALGLSAKEAFFATAKKHAPMSDNRAHLGGSVPRSVHTPKSAMSPAELIEARGIFDGLSDEEIRSLYRKVTGQR